MYFYIIQRSRGNRLAEIIERDPCEAEIQGKHDEATMIHATLISSDFGFHCIILNELTRLPSDYRELAVCAEVLICAHPGPKKRPGAEAWWFFPTLEPRASLPLSDYTIPTSQIRDRPVKHICTT